MGASRGATTPQSERVLGDFDERAWCFLRDMVIARELEGAQLLPGGRKSSGQVVGVGGVGAAQQGAGGVGGVVGGGGGGGTGGGASASSSTSASKGKAGATPGVLPSSLATTAIVPVASVVGKAPGDLQRASVYLASSAATLDTFLSAMQDWYLRPR